MQLPDNETIPWKPNNEDIEERIIRLEEQQLTEYLYTRELLIRDLKKRLNS